MQMILSDYVERLNILEILNSVVLGVEKLQILTIKKKPAAKNKFFF